MKPSKVSIGGGGFPLSHGDARDDLGYGRLQPKYHIPKMLGNDSYPYRDQDEDLEDVETGLDDDVLDDLMAMIDQPRNFDPGGGHYDPFSFAGSNTSLSGPAHISEKFSPAPNMVPTISRKFKKTSQVPVGGTGSGTARGDASTMAPRFDTGDRWGWSNPPLHDLFDEESEEESVIELTDGSDSDCEITKVVTKDEKAEKIN